MIDSSCCNVLVFLCNSKPICFLQSDEVKHFVYNHLSFRVMFRKHLANDSAQIVGFEVTPFRFLLSTFVLFAASVCILP